MVNLKLIRSILLVLVCTGWSGKAACQADGARMHLPAPTGLHVVQLRWMALLDANSSFDPSLVTPRSKFDTNMVTLQYAHTRSIGGRYVALMAMLRGGKTEGRFGETGMRASSSGFADPFIGFSVNLFGLPPMDPEAFADFRPDTTMNLLTGITPPLGEYDNDNLLNLGSNRWAFRFSLPLTHSFSWGPGATTALEIVPSLRLFTDNKDRQLKQDPLLTLDAQVTHDFSNRTWGGLGMIYSNGGATTVRGVEQNGRQESLGLSATLGIRLGARYWLHLNYGETVAHNDAGLKGTLYRARIVAAF